MESTSDALILGGGFAGLSAAVALADRGLCVTVLEKKSHLGGRAYSFKDPATGDPVDNGQHLFMGCYRHTRRFLERLGTAPLLRFAKGVRVDFADSSGARDALVCPSWLGAPLHLAWGILGLRGLSWTDKWGLVRLKGALKGLRRSAPSPEMDRLTVRQWLGSIGQSPRIQTRLFDPIALGALNDDPTVASATGFAQALSEMFFSDAEGSRLGLSTVGLSDLYTSAAQAAVESAGGRILLSQKAAALIEDGGRVTGVVTESGESFRAAATVSTLPPWDLVRLGRLPALRGKWDSLKPSPIVSLCLWLDRPAVREEIVGLLDTDIQWVFNKSRLLGRSNEDGQYLSLVISGARRHVSWEPKALLQLAERDLSRCFPAFRKAKITGWKVVKEPYATLSPVPGTEALRPLPGIAAPGLFLAGDWTRTGLPATIESAVASGHAAAESVLK